MSNSKLAVMSEFASIMGHFDGHMGALKWYMRHRQMQHGQGYSWSHWVLTLGDYLLRITLVAARATANKAKMQNTPILLTISMAITMRRYYTACIAQWRRSRAFIKATEHSHRMSTRSNSSNQTHQRRLFLWFHREKGLELTWWPLITIGMWHIKLMRST